MNSRYPVLSAGLACALAFGAAQAEPLSDSAGRWSFGVFAGKGVHNDLRDIPGDTFGGNLDFAHSYVGEGFVRYGLETPHWFPGASPDAYFPVTTSIEVGVYAYRGYTDNGAFSIDWRPEVELLRLGGTAIDLGWGFGFWRSMGDPWYNHASHPEYNHRYKTLFHMTPEITFRTASLPGWSLGLRDNHVSGIYGVVAPASLGTNHLGVVVAKDF